MPILCVQLNWFARNGIELSLRECCGRN